MKDAEGPDLSGKDEQDGGSVGRLAV
jgi:hypothetical protein